MKNGSIKEVDSTVGMAEEPMGENERKRGVEQRGRSKHKSVREKGVGREVKGIRVWSRKEKLVYREKSMALKRRRKREGKRAWSGKEK